LLPEPLFPARAVAGDDLRRLRLPVGCCAAGRELLCGQCAERFVGLLYAGREDVDAGEPCHVVFLRFAQEEPVDGFERLDEGARFLVGALDVHAAVIHAVEIGCDLLFSLLGVAADCDEAQCHGQ